MAEGKLVCPAIGRPCEHFERVEIDYRTHKHPGLCWAQGKGNKPFMIFGDDVECCPWESKIKEVEADPFELFEISLRFYLRHVPGGANVHLETILDTAKKYWPKSQKLDVTEIMRNLDSMYNLNLDRGGVLECLKAGGYNGE